MQFEVIDASEIEKNQLICYFFFWLKEYVNYLDRFFVMLGSPLL